MTKKQPRAITLQVNAVINKHDSGYTIDWAGEGYRAYSTYEDMAAAITDRVSILLEDIIEIRHDSLGVLEFNLNGELKLELVSK